MKEIMENYIATGFNEIYWKRWGVSWIASLREFAEYKGDILVVNFGLSISTRKKLAELGVTILPGGYEANFRVGILNAISEFAEKHSGIFAVWDADVYFQDNIDEIFDLAKDQLVITDNVGFYAGTSKDLASFKEIQNLISFIQQENHFAHEYLPYFPQARKIGNTWNFTEVTKLQDDGKFTFNNEIQKVIHPAGPIKDFLPGRKIAFWERHKDVFKKYSDGNYYTSNRRLVSKNDCTSENIDIQSIE